MNDTTEKKTKNRKILNDNDFEGIITTPVNSAQVKKSSNKPKKKVNKGDKLYYLIVQTVLLTVMFFSLGMIGMKVYSYVSESEYYEGVINDYQISFDNPAAEIEKTAPAYPMPTPERLSYPVGPSKQTLLDLEAKNEDFCMWLYIEDTNINYYVLQSDDNDYYLSRNIDGKNFKAGSLILDFRNDADKMSGHTIIYGHNMHNKSMFGHLKLYLEKEFFDSHQYFYTYTPEEVTVWKVFSVRTTTTDEYYIKTAFSTKESYYDFLVDFREKSIYDTDVIVTAEDDVLTLTTCHKYEHANGRLVVHAVKVGTGILAS
ncbi:MAG: class B sortase [Ruminococcaceae bacterium]|nr:class B sortase [Oscillospiraceae bacterium]